MSGYMGGGGSGGAAGGGGMDIPCPNCGTTMLRMSSGATCPECGAFIGGGGGGVGTLGGIAESLATKEFRGVTASKGKARAGVYGDWPTTIAKGTRVGFEKDGVIVVGVVKEYDVDEETGAVTMTIE